jgi:hypothetical protein
LQFALSKNASFFFTFWERFQVEMFTLNVNVYFLFVLSEKNDFIKMLNLSKQSKNVKIQLYFNEKRKIRLKCENNVTRVLLLVN